MPQIPPPWLRASNTSRNLRLQELSLPFLENKTPGLAVKTSRRKHRIFFF